MRRAVAVGLAALLVGVLAGCGGDDTEWTRTAGGLPFCSPEAGGVNRGVLLMAQSVPTARWLPCVRYLPNGWGLHNLDARDGKATLTLDFDRNPGVQALRVVLRARCDVSGLTEVTAPMDPSGVQRGVRRFDRPGEPGRTGYHDERYYRFPGGCIAVRFDLDGDTPDAVEVITGAMGLVSRDQLAGQVRTASDGWLTLDPGTAP